MTSTPVKNIGAVAGGAGITASTAKTSGQAGFEAVWNRQTDKNSAKQMNSENSRTVSRKDDVVVRDSLKAKDVRESTKQTQTADEANELREMDPREWEEAMEVLGAAAEEMIQQIADAFGLQPEQVHEIMADLDMSQLDLLQTDKLAQLLLVAGGAQDMTALLTNGELYQKYQALMAQAQELLAECSENLQTDAGQLVDAALRQETAIPVEITVEGRESVEEPRQQNADEDVIISAEKEAQSTAESLEGASAEHQTGQYREGAADQENAMQGRQAANSEQHGNLMIQNLRTEQFAQQPGLAAEPVPIWDADTQDIMRQIMDYMRIQVKPDMSDLEMQLHPESFGTLQIHVASKGGTITAQFITQNEAVKAALESQMVQLKENFVEQGVKVDAIEVTVQTHQFEQNLEQGRGRQQSEPGRRARTRRIQLDGPLDISDLNDMKEEEQLAARMMEANGNTVDYTA